MIHKVGANVMERA